MTNVQEHGSSKESVFPFHHLPVLIQWKILRQYTPALCKTTVLSRLSEFSELLDCPQSWLSEKFSEVSRLFSSLEPGFYWSLENGSNTGYYVSINSEKITFKLCYIIENEDYNYINSVFDSRFNSSSDQNTFKCCFQSCISLQTMQKFLTKFFNKNTLAMSEMIRIYQVKYPRYFFLNRVTNVLCWDDGKYYKMENNKCVVKESPRKTYVFILKEYDIIECSLVSHSFVIDKREIEPQSLKSYLLDRNFSDVERDYLCDLDFKIIDENHISFTKTVDDLLFEFLPKKDILKKLSTIFEELTLLEPLEECGCEIMSEDSDDSYY